MLHDYVRSQSLCGSFLTVLVCRPSCFITCITHIYLKVHRLREFRFAQVDKMVVKNHSRCQTLGQFTGVNFPDLNPNSYHINDIIKFDLNIATKAKFNSNDQKVITGFF